MNDITHGDFNYDGQDEILIGTEGFQFYVLTTLGKPIFRQTLADRVLKVSGFRENGKAIYLAGTAGGRLYKLTTGGKVADLIQFPGEIANILIGNPGSESWIVLATGDVYRMD